METIEYLIKKISTNSSNYEDFIKDFLNASKILLNSKAVLVIEQDRNSFIVKNTDDDNSNLINQQINYDLISEIQNKETLIPTILNNPIIANFSDKKYYITILDENKKLLLCLAKDDILEDVESKIFMILVQLYKLYTKMNSSSESATATIINLIDRNFGLYISSLQSIIGSLVFLKNEIPGPHLIELLNNIYNQCYGILISLTEQKDFQKLLFEKVECSIVDVDIKKIIENYYNYYTNKIKDKQIQVQFNNTPANNFIKSDHQKLNFIVEKILGFLIRYSSANVISVDFVEENFQIKQINFTCDNFTLSQTVLDKIFFPDTLNMNYDGKFIPLTNFSFPLISYYLEVLNHYLNLVVDQSNKVVVSLTVNKKFEAPFRKIVSSTILSKNEVSQDNTVTESKAEGTKEEVKPKYKILLAEDYKHSQIIVTRLLKKNGYEDVVTAENGQEAVDAAKAHQFNLILMDMQMPLKSGFEAIQEIRQMDNYKDIPIIALTAFAMKGEKEKCIEAGATDYIPKPIDSKELLEKIAQYLNKN